MIRVNLLKPEKKEIKEEPGLPPPEYKEKKKPPIGILFILFLIILIGILFFLQRRAINKEQTLLEKAQKEKQELQYVLVKLEKLEKQKSMLEKKINLIQRLKSRQDSAVIIMDMLSQNIPEWVWLTETNYKPQSLQIKGKALSNNLIADYISNLDGSPYFENVNLISSTQRQTRNNQYLEFSLTANYVAPSLPTKGNTQKENQ